MKKLGLLVEWKIVASLLLGNSRKHVAREFGCSISKVAQVKAKYPLFFWRSKRRYLWRSTIQFRNSRGSRRKWKQ